MSNPHQTAWPSKKRSVGNSLFKFIGQEKKLIIFVFLFVAAWINIFSLFFYKPDYLASSMVIVKDSAITRQYVRDPIQENIQTTSNIASSSVLNTMGLLKTDAIGHALYRFFKTRYPKELKELEIENLEDWEKFYKDGSSYIKAKNPPGTDIISVDFVWPNAKIAKEGLEDILTSFQDASLNLNRLEQVNRSKYLTEKVGGIEEKLAAVRLEKNRYKDQLKASNIDQYSMDLTKTITDLENQLNTKEAEAQSHNVEYHKYEQMLGMSTQEALDASRVGMNSNLTSLQEKLYTLMQQKKMYDATLTDHNPEVQQVNAQIEELKTSIATELHKTLGPNAKVSPDKIMVMGDLARGDIISRMANAQTAAKSLYAEIAVLKNRLAAIHHQVPLLNQGEKDLAKIQEEEHFLGNELDKLHEKQLEARLKEADTLSNVFIINAPEMPKKPKFPNKPQLCLLGLFLGLVASGLAVYTKQRVLQLMHPPAEKEFAAITNGHAITAPDDDSDNELVESSRKPH